MRRSRELKGKPTKTKESQEVYHYANIGRLSNLDAFEANDAEEIGRFRSELLYLESVDFPTEKFQFQAYKEVAQRMGDKPVIICPWVLVLLSRSDISACSRRRILFSDTGPSHLTDQAGDSQGVAQGNPVGICLWVTLPTCFPMITSTSEVD